MREKRDKIASQDEKERHHFTLKENAIRLLGILILTVFSYALMLFGEIPVLKIHGFLGFEISDAVALLSYFLYGYVASLFVIVGKTALLLSTFLSSNNGVFINYIAALINSLIYLSLFAIADRVLAVFNKKIQYRLIFYFFYIILVSLISVAFDYLCFYPTYLSGKNSLWFSESFTSLLASDTQILPIENDYTKSVFYLFFPFNLVKSTLVCVVYEFLLAPVVFKYLKSGLFEVKFFMNRYDYKREEILLSLHNSLEKKETVQQIKDKRLLRLKKSNDKKSQNQDEKSKAFITKQAYEYQMQVIKGQVMAEYSITAESEHSSLIVNFMRNCYPTSRYSLTSYKERGEVVKDASTDGLDFDLFHSIHGYDKLVVKLIEVVIQIR